MLEIEFKNANRYLPKFSTRVNKMKNLILLIIVLLTLLLIGCEKKGRDMYPGYVGEKKDGVPHGQGTKTSENETYIGKWRNGLQHGKGVLTKSDGSNYDGGWVFGNSTQRCCQCSFLRRFQGQPRHRGRFGWPPRKCWQICVT